MKVLVTGHMGKIGQRLLPALILANHEVRGSDKKSGGDLMVPGSAREAVKSFLPDVIMHLAGVQEGLMAGLAMEYNAKLIIVDQKEERLLGDVVSLRLGTVYGPGMGGVIGQMIDQEALSRPDNQNPRGVDIVSGGIETLDFIHISDVIRAFIEAMEWEPGYYEVATGIESSVWDAFRLLTFAWGYTPKKNEVGVAVHGSFVYPYRTRCDLGWTPISLEQGLARTVTGL